MKLFQNFFRTFSETFSLLFLLCINDKPQTVKCELLLYADDTCLIFKHNDINEIEIQLNKNLIYD